MLYITFTKLYAEGMEGVRDKVFSQVAAFERRIGNTKLTYLINGMVYLFDNQTIVDKRPAATRKQLYYAIEFWIEKYSVNMTYVRIPPACDFNFIEFMRYQKEKGIKTVVEIPTYPYDGECTDNREHREDLQSRQFLKEYTDYIATSSSEKSIWGIPCIRISNGVDIENYEFSNIKKNDGLIKMTAMASSFIWWNGFERAIEGIHKYYSNGGKRNINLVFIGDGGDEKKYEELVHRHSLEGRVTFKGRLSREQINEVLSETDIAISCLGVHRKKMSEVEPMRVPVFCSKGIPIIGDYNDPRFSKGCKYYLKVSPDEEPINIADVLNWFDQLGNDKEYRKEIRMYAEDHFSWDSTMSDVVNYYLKK